MVRATGENLTVRASFFAGLSRFSAAAASGTPSGSRGRMEGGGEDDKATGGGSNNTPVLREILPKCGLVVSEKGNLSEVLCKPKILPIKSAHVERLEQLAKAAMEGPESKQQEEKE